MNMTDIIIGSRGSGKTTELFKRSADEHLYILTGTKGQAQCLFAQAREMGYNIPFPVSWEEFVRGDLDGTSIQEDGVLIDEAAHVLSRALRGIPIKAATWTKYGHRDLDEENPEKYLDWLWKCYQWTGTDEAYAAWLNARERFKEKAELDILKKENKELHETLQNAYRVIGQLIDKPNCFQED